MKIIYGLCLAVLIGCSKGPEPVPEDEFVGCIDGVNAELKDYTGLDGCGWVIKLEDGQVLEPINLDDFEVELEDGNLIHISYNGDVEMTSICMVGEMVELICLIER